MTALAGLACTAMGQSVLAVTQPRYELRAGETVPIVAAQETLDFLIGAKRRDVAIVTAPAVAGASVMSGSSASTGLVASLNRAGNQILLGASLRMKPGEYTVNLSATGASGAQRQTTLTVVVKPHVTVPTGSTRPPVVLLNGWELGFTGACPVAASASDDFGNLAPYLVSDGVPVVYLFDNCLEDPGQTEEKLGNDLGTILNSITYDNGEQVPQIDLVGFSLGGLIARSYLAGLQPSAILTPTTTLVRNLVLIATPNFGSYVAGVYASSLAAGSQNAELEPGSSFLWNLATWNQLGDDLRGVNAIGIMGNAGTYVNTAGVSLGNASDGLVSLTSASLGFVSPAVAGTRIVPYCHVDPGVFTNTVLGAFDCDAAGIANVSTTTHETGIIVRSFLSGTTGWQSVGSAPSADPYLSKNGQLYFALVNGTDSYVSDLTEASFGTVPLINGGDTGNHFLRGFRLRDGRFIGPERVHRRGQLRHARVTARRRHDATLQAGHGDFLGRPTDRNQRQSGERRFDRHHHRQRFWIAVQWLPCGCRSVGFHHGAGVDPRFVEQYFDKGDLCHPSLTGLLTVQVFAAAGTDAIEVMAISQSTLAVTPTALQFSPTRDGGSSRARRAVHSDREQRERHTFLDGHG